MSPRSRRRLKSQSALITAVIFLALTLIAILLAWAEGRQGAATL